MNGIGLVKLFYSGVVYKECKCCLAVLVAPAACGTFQKFLATGLFVQISQQITHIQAYIRTKKRTRSYTEEDLHGIKWPIDRPTNTAADTATASAEASADAPDALVDAPA